MNSCNIRRSFYTF